MSNGLVSPVLETRGLQKKEVICGKQALVQLGSRAVGVEATSIGRNFSANSSSYLVTK